MQICVASQDAEDAAGEAPCADTLLDAEDDLPLTQLSDKAESHKPLLMTVVEIQ